MAHSPRFHKALLLLLGFSFLIRATLACLLEFGNDEVYYWTYAMFPDWSHFDHPPMVGWLIQAFTLNLWLDHEFFIRLGAIIGGTVSAWLIFLIGKQIKDERLGFYAAAMYTASIYSSVIAGTFILPDSGQIVFWLGSMYFLVLAFSSSHESVPGRRAMLIAGLFIGLAMLSKYTSVLLWFGALGYIVSSARQWLRSPWLYFALVISILMILPVVYWNWQESFVSFTFHGDRVEVTSYRLRFDYFITEIFGTILYQNPVNAGIIFVSLFSFIRGRMNKIPAALCVILWCSVPLAMIMPAISLFRSTLPHWSGPAYAGLILMASLWLWERNSGSGEKAMFFPRVLKFSLSLILVFAMAAAFQVRTGVFLNKEVKSNGRSAEDPSLDMYGWRQLGTKFKVIYDKDQVQKTMKPGVVMLSWRWFPAANLDYYVANPIGVKLFAEGSLERIHKYAWINRIRGGIPAGSDAYFISSDRDFVDPARDFATKYKTLLPPDTIGIERSGKRVMEFYVYRLIGRLP